MNSIFEQTEASDLSCAVMDNQPSWRFVVGSQGNIEPWGRDFWSHNLLSEILVVIGLPILIVIIVGIIVALALFY